MSEIDEQIQEYISINESSEDIQKSQTDFAENQQQFRNKVRHWELKWVKTQNIWDFESDIYIKKWICENTQEGAIMDLKHQQKINCEKVFFDQMSLKKHSLNHGEKLYICPVEKCGKKFVDKSKLRRHQLVHTGERPYRCDICNKCFSLDFNLRTHMRTHTGERPYTCLYPNCNKRFTQSSNLVAHEKMHLIRDKTDNTEVNSENNENSENSGQQIYNAEIAKLEEMSIVIENEI